MKRAARLGFLVVLVVVTWGQTGAVAAQEDAFSEAPPAQGPIVSITFSPLHLILPMFELTAEARVGDYCGIALLGGFGAMTLEAADNDLNQDVHFTLWELGAQVIAYPLEPFESLQLGAELQYAHVSVDETLDGRRVSGFGAGLLVGPLVGYKLLTDVGFTLFVQGGVAFIAVQADVEDDRGESATAEEKRVIPLLNLNLGWSF